MAHRIASRVAPTIVMTPIGAVAACTQRSARAVVGERDECICPFFLLRTIVSNMMDTLVAWGGLVGDHVVTLTQATPYWVLVMLHSFTAVAANRDFRMCAVNAQAPLLAAASRRSRRRRTWPPPHRYPLAPGSGWPAGS